MTTATTSARDKPALSTRIGAVEEADSSTGKALPFCNAALTVGSGVADASSIGTDEEGRTAVALGVGGTAVGCAGNSSCLTV